MNHHAAHRVPRAGLDRIDSAAAALAVVRLAVHQPLRHETIALFLDHERCGLGLTVVAHTLQTDDVVEVTDRLVEAAVASEAVGGLVVASVRPDTDGCDMGDADRWLEMSELAEAIGLELLEWFVVGTRVHCPRDLLGEAPRW